jgi:hypothetical protein
LDFDQLPFFGRRWLWITVTILLVWGLFAASRGKAGLPPPLGGGGSDLQMYAAVTKRVAAGENYYRVLADELPSRGYATRPLFNWRLPTLTWLNILPPTRLWSRVVLVGLCCAVILMWVVVLKQFSPRVVPAGMVIFAMGVGPLMTISASVLFYEVWSGLFIAASLAAWALGGRKASVALGACALFIRELALPYVAIMAALAWREDRKREAAAWASVAGAFGVFWAWHLLQVVQVLPADGLRNGWLVGGGWGFVLAAAHSSIFLMLIPEPVEQWVVALVLPFLWAGFWHWTDQFGRRLALVVTGYFAMFMVAGRPDNWYWGFLIATLIPLGAFGYFFKGRRWTKASS